MIPDRFPFVGLARAFMHPISLKFTSIRITPSADILYKNPPDTELSPLEPGEYTLDHARTIIHDPRTGIDCIVVDEASRTHLFKRNRGARNSVFMYRLRRGEPARNVLPGVYIKNE